MPRRRSLSSTLFKLAHTARTGEAIGKSLETENPGYAERRARNILWPYVLSRPTPLATPTVL